MITDLRPYQKAGRYIRYHGHIICLNCTAYFRSRCTVTQLNRMTHEGWKKARYCPVCGAELKEEINRFRPEQLTLLRG